MCSSVMVKALQSGWEVFSHMAGFFSAATDVCPVIGAELMCRALAIVESRVSSLESGPTPMKRDRERSEVRNQDWCTVSAYSSWRHTLQSFGQIHVP